MISKSHEFMNAQKLKHKCERRYVDPWIYLQTKPLWLTTATRWKRKLNSSFLLNRPFSCFRLVESLLVCSPCGSHLWKWLKFGTYLQIFWETLDLCVHILEMGHWSSTFEQVCKHAWGLFLSSELQLAMFPEMGTNGIFHKMASRVELPKSETSNELFCQRQTWKAHFVCKSFCDIVRKSVCFWPFPSVRWLWTWWSRCEWTFLDGKATIWSKTHSKAFHWNIKTKKYHKFRDIKYILKRTVIHSPHIRCSQASHPWSPILETWPSLQNVLRTLGL